MTDLPKYKEYKNDSLPNNFKSRTQLIELGLVPLKAVAILETTKYDISLYDINDPGSCYLKRAPSKKRLEKRAVHEDKIRAEQQYKEWQNNRKRLIESDKIAAAKWAKKKLKKNNWIIANVKAAVSNDTEIAEIAIVNHQGIVLIDTFVKLTTFVPNNVTQVYDVGNEIAINLLSFSEVYLQIVEAIEGKQILVYDLPFTTQVLNSSCRLHGLPILKLTKCAYCLMDRYAQWKGDWNYVSESYRSYPLSVNHRALDNCLIMLEKLKSMADGNRHLLFNKN